jgi:hypothetical protein
LDPEVANTFGGYPSSTNYKLTDSGGEAAAKNGQTSTSYRLGTGFVAELAQSLLISLNPSSVTIPNVTAGASQLATTDVTVNTDAPDFTLAINQDHDLRHTDATTTISPNSNSIASPGLWTEGTTKGLGFSLISGAQVNTTTWGSNPNYKYAAIPGAATTYHTHNGFLGGTPDTTTVQYRLDVNSSQKGGNYSNTVTYTLTTIP